MTRSDQVLAECLAAAPWELYLRAITGRWESACDRVQNALNLYGLGRN